MFGQYGSGIASHIEHFYKHPRMIQVRKSRLSTEKNISKSTRPNSHSSMHSFVRYICPPHQSVLEFPPATAPPADCHP